MDSDKHSFICGFDSGLIFGNAPPLPEPSIVVEQREKKREAGLVCRSDGLLFGAV